MNALNGLARIPKRYHFPDNIPSPPVSGTDLVVLSQTRDMLQQMVKDWLVAHKDICYDELYRLAQDCHRQGLYRRVIRHRLIARYQNRNSEKTTGRLNAGDAGTGHLCHFR